MKKKYKIFSHNNETKNCILFFNIVQIKQCSNFNYREDDHEGILKLFPKSEFKYVEDAGHWVHSEKPVEFLDLVCKFLNNIN